MVSKSLAQLQILTDKLQQRDNELKESATRLKLALGAAKAGMWHWCLTSNSLLWDKRMFEMLRPDMLNDGIDPNKWTGTYDLFIECIHEDDRERVKSYIEKCVDDQSYFNCKYRVVCPTTGQIKHIKALGQVVEKASEQLEECGSNVCMTGVCIDITDEEA